MNIVIGETTARKAQVGRRPRISNPFQIIEPITFVTLLTYMAYHVGSRFPTFRRAIIFDVGGNVGNIHFQIQRAQRRRWIWILYGQDILVHILAVRTGQIILRLLASFGKRNILFARFLIVPLGKAILLFLERVFVRIFPRAWIMFHIIHLPAYRECALIGIFYNFFRNHSILYFREAKVRLLEIRVLRVSPRIISYIRLRGFCRGLLTGLVVDALGRALLGRILGSRDVRKGIRVRINVHVRVGGGAHRIFHLYV